MSIRSTEYGKYRFTELVGFITVEEGEAVFCLLGTERQGVLPFHTEQIFPYFYSYEPSIVSPRGSLHFFGSEKAQLLKGNRGLARFSGGKTSKKR